MKPLIKRHLHLNIWFWGIFLEGARQPKYICTSMFMVKEIFRGMKLHG